MVAYIIRRLLWMIPTLLAMALVTFHHYAPDPGESKKQIA